MQKASNNTQRVNAAKKDAGGGGGGGPPKQGKKGKKPQAKGAAVAGHKGKGGGRGSAPPDKDNRATRPHTSPDSNQDKSDLALPHLVGRYVGLFSGGNILFRDLSILS